MKQISKPDKDTVQRLFIRICNLQAEYSCILEDQEFTDSIEYLSEVNRALRILHARLEKLGVTYDERDKVNITNIYHNGKLWMQFDLNQLDSSSFVWTDCNQEATEV